MINTINILDELILLHQDRIKVYQSAINNFSKDIDKELINFSIEVIDQASLFIHEISAMIRMFEIAVSPADKGLKYLYGASNKISSDIFYKERAEILKYLLSVEDLTQEIYENAVSDQRLDNTARSLASRQKNILWQTHDRLKFLKAKSA